MLNGSTEVKHPNDWKLLISPHLLTKYQVSCNERCLFYVKIDFHEVLIRDIGKLLSISCAEIFQLFLILQCCLRQRRNEIRFRCNGIGN